MSRLTSCEIIKIVVAWMLLSVFSADVCFAGVDYLPVEIQCSRYFFSAPWITFNGSQNTWYTLTTEGIRVDARGGAEEVVRIGKHCQMRDGVRVHVEARCLPSGEMTTISLTGGVLACGLGEGIAVKMFAPNDVNPDKYHYIGSLRRTSSEIKSNEVIQASPPSETELLRQRGHDSQLLGGESTMLQFRSSTGKAKSESAFVEWPGSY